MRRNYNRIIVAVLACILVLAAMSPAVAYAATPYVTYTIDGYGRISQTQTAYLAYETITKFGEETLSSPSDIQVTDDGLVYVADSGNARIVVGNLEGDLVRTFGEGTLVNPQGLYVTDDGLVYVADRDAGQIYIFDEEGALAGSYGKPTSPLYGDLSFLPIKIVVNDAGIMFVICESNTNGIVEISPTEGGTFLGYFGTNYASQSLTTIIYRAILTDAQRAKMVSNIPATPTNLGIDDKGLIYTVTRGNETYTLKLLNIAGTNVMGEDKNNTYADTPVDVAAGNHDNVYVVDQQGYIFEYNNNGEMLFVFGGPDDGTQRVGLCSMVSGIAVDSEDRIYVLDSDKCQIQVYEPTEFTDLLHQALYLYSKGRYTESKEPLSQVLEMNSMFDYANKAMGRAYFQEENYQMALHYARLAKDYEGYSDAYWEIRNVWLKQNIMTVILVCVLLWAISKAISVLDKKKFILDKPRAWLEDIKSKPIITDICYAGYYIKNPFDGAYGISHEGRANWITSTLLLVVFIIEYVVNKYTCGFLVKNVMEGRYEILQDIGTVVVLMVALTACTYLVCTINDGEGTVKKLYTMFCYSLVPYIILTPISYLMSHVLTNNEVFLVTMLNLVIYGWTIVIAVAGLKEVNNFTMGETVKIIFLTVFAALILALLIFIIYVLWAQVFEFVTAIVGEVVYNLGY